MCWKIGGFGIWWPNKTENEEGPHKFSANEVNFLNIDEVNKGMMLWNTSNSLRGSSTRTEIGGLLGGLLAENSIHAGIDNSAAVNGANKAISHIKRRSAAVLRTVTGALRLGGRLSPLHRESPWHCSFHYLNNGDLWEAL